MLLTKFDPLREFTNMQKMFEAFNAPVASESSLGAFTPKVNTREGEFAYHIDVDLPGVKKDDIKIDVHDNILTIHGERNYKEEIKEEDYYKVETSFGKFQRQFTLPDNVDVENISASSNDGVLEVVVPKLEKAVEKKTIEVK
ncbi:Hsp20/alpha crystallin family protein [Aliarcobacter butzleri]|jgi:HSP20 family protein|uniref:Hsp20/alpha crystallin family protein n=2 Tax=Aliarcobacter butzleri TaxID=28197 RepID=A0AAP4PDS4_9BACT|nr:Hsp20/alpha crystallin family protein [Aliarcobacter butzleri]MBP6323133.1 Hsp20/alpha crystallin family protein [Fusobacteriaceae bacterium]MBP9616120.1 Hsp20/alpha crystallin family protein [Aliarcobacter sp.]MDN5053281.1 Hsp20/alpha crystallin family protein [Aliarcobacter butzleri]MDN5062552.1 Hsp20/alpha crystallin family protein [Aliarcobacter butzleri]MDN5076513.1 Hsp20/alpha crystallin family protein [Aliarcobacter butzleri]